ncbi:hypothetical protein G5I_05460 [Acromyrmex echinatior]|uniref:Uncharacterized protein n=1 Tax=Acromyrmex echinatior TaxID=103372 RepID=F4WID7_ACREC|nr:hypothetical protein G5I_05460 [Acromyrmex echinatior]
MCRGSHYHAHLTSEKSYACRRSAPAVRTREAERSVPERSEVNSKRTFILERMYECTQWRNYANPHPFSTLLSTFPSSEHPLGDHPVRVVDARWVRRSAYLTALQARAYYAAQLSTKETGWQKKKSHRRRVTFSVSESGGRPSIPALLDRVTVGRGRLHSGTFGQLKEMKITKRLSQSVGAKCLRTMRELCGFLFHDADPLTGRKRERRGGSAGVVGYNGSLSREMTADGNRDVEIYRKEIARIIAAILHA